ncbi:MAG: tyrosine-type recombinase/integrase [Lachnospiraceae bacterium]
MCRTISIYKNENQEILNSLANNLPGFFITQNNQGTDTIIKQLLQIHNHNGNMSTSACAKIIVEFTQKEERVKEICDLSKIKTRPDDGRVYLIVKRKPISSTSYIGLIEKLYEHFYGIENATMEQYFEVWMEWRSSESSVSPKTIKENRFLWNALLKDTEITTIPLKTLKVQDYISFFRKITKGREITRKRFNDLKSIMNGILYLAVENGIIDRNCLRDINYKQFTYKAENTDISPYSEDERLRIIDYLSNIHDDFYSLAILLDFHLVLRIGELKGLKWSDITGDSIRIQRFVNDKNEIIDDIKGHANEGKRNMPLTPKAKEILEKIKYMNPDSEYLFIRNGQPLATVTFNRHLKRCCDALNIKYRSSHKLRFSTASIMYKNGIDDTELQKLLGHTSLTMTRHYLRNVTSDEETASKMSAILG